MTVSPREGSNPAPVPARPKVLYILGWGRSGSTLMDNILGEIDGFFSVGELHYLWERGLLEGGPCGCSLPVSDCPVWSRVMAALTDRVGPVDPKRALQLQRSVVRNRQVFRLIGASRSPGSDPDLQEYARLMEGLYGAIAEVTGARVVVDSSKRIPGAFLLGMLEGVDPYFVHLVRDPRAVAYSWQRSKEQPGAARPEMRQFSPASSTVRWLLWTAGAGRVRRQQGEERSTWVPYERFMAEPRTVIEEIVSLVGEGPKDLPFVGERHVALHPNHTISGNPSRFRSGTTELRLDDQWIGEQGWRDRMIATCIALPLLRSYGYHMHPTRRGPTPQRSS